MTALASYLVARNAAGAWLLRIDDLDRARCIPRMESTILRQLEAHGFEWDESARRQSEHLAEYGEALDELGRQGLLYRCVCTRQQLRQAARLGPDGPVYSGTCRHRQLTGRGAVRFRVPAVERCFDDGWQGRQCRQLERDVGDFVVRRANGEFAYQLACAVDEHAQAITEVVRGADLLGSTFQQCSVLEQLGRPTPRYRHLAVLMDAQGRKLSKQNRATPVAASAASANLHACLELLGQRPPGALRGEPVAEILRWGIGHWDAARVSRAAQIAGSLAYNAVQQSPDDAP